MSEQFIQDMAIAASFACDNYFSADVIEEDIEQELPVGDTLDAEQITTFVKVLGGELDVDDCYDDVSADYDISGIHDKLTRHGCLYDVYWDEILEILLRDNEEQ